MEKAAGKIARPSVSYLHCPACLFIENTHIIGFHNSIHIACHYGLKRKGSYWAFVDKESGALIG